MENGHKPRNMDGVVAMMVVESTSSKARPHDAVLRILCLLLTLIAAILVGADKESKSIPVTLLKTVPPLKIPVTAKWQYMSAFVYLLVSNAIACSYAAGSIMCSMAAARSRTTRNNNMRLVLIILDMIIAGLLFSANGAAAAVGVIGRYGNSHVEWNKVCNVFDGFCRQLGAAFVLSLLASFVFLVLVVIAVFNLHRKLIAVS